MSYIFSGLARKPTAIAERQSNDLSLEESIYKPSVLFDKAIKCFVIGKDEKSNNFLKINVETDDWDDLNLSLWTSKETFLLNSNKLAYLKDVVNNVPKLMFMFRPAYGVQLALRYIVRNISGVTDKQELSNIILGNNEILGYFLQFYKLCKDVYTGVFISNLGAYDKKFSRGLILAIIELMNLLRDDTPELLRVSPMQLSQWGDDSFIISGTETTKGKNLVIQRGKTYDPDMNTIDRFCLVCNQHYADIKSLLIHLKQHDQFVCTDCSIQVRSYKELACHYITFCRATKWSAECVYCLNTKEKCVCLKINERFMDLLQSFTEAQGRNEVYANDLLSTLTQYYCVNNLFDPMQTLEEAYTMLSDEISDEQVITFEKVPTNDDIAEAIEQYLPQVYIDRDQITSKGLALSTTWHNLKQVLGPSFESYHDAELLIINKLSGLRHFCLYRNCTKAYSLAHHLESHSTCVFSRSLDATEIPLRYASFKKYTKHAFAHVVNMGEEAKLNCVFCDLSIDTHEGINFGGFLMHAASHLEDKQQVFDSKCTNTELTVCREINLISAMDVFFHKLLWHIKSDESLILYIRDMAYESSSNKSKRGVVTCIKLDKKADITQRLNFNTDEESKQLFNNTNIRSNTKRHQNVVNKYNASNSSDSSDDHSDDEDGDNGEEKRNIKNNALIGKDFYCKNEKHEKYLHFTTEVALQKHIIENHTCSFKGCNFSAMMESTLLQHYEIHLHDRMEAKCAICDKIVKDLNTHLKEHPRCKSCQVRFENLAILRMHEPECTKIKQGTVQVFNNVESNTTSLNVDTTDLESKFSGLIQKLLHDSSLTSIEKSTGAQIIEKYTSSNAIAKNRLRIDAINNRRNDALLFDVPCFAFQDKPQLHKVLSSIGEVKLEEKFNPTIQHSNQNCVVNFETFELLLKKIESLVLLGNLNEILTVALLQRFIGQPVIDAVTSYQQKSWEELSFQSILESIQWIYIPIKLNIFQTYVLSYRHDKSIESFLEFSSKVFRHLKLCARLKPKEERLQYIEHHQRKILKRNLPIKLLDAIEAKESLYTAFTSKEIIDHYVSWVHNQSDGRGDQDKYNVFVTKIKPAPATLRSKSNENLNSEIKKRQGNKRNNKRFARNSRVNEVNANFRSTKKVPKLPCESSKEKLKQLQEMGVITTFPTCFLCLDKHLLFNCKLYKDVKVSDKLCTQFKNGKEVAMGYHSECRHGDDKEKEFGRRARDGRPKVTVWRPRNK